MDGEPFPPGTAKSMILGCLKDTGTVSFSEHACDEMETDNLIPNDVINTLRAGIVEPGELEKRTYRYRVSTGIMFAVIAFRSATHLVVVTAWRKERS
jgi:hypothetical protein